MILSLVLLGVLEYLWLHNEYNNKHRDMEEKLNHVMFTSMRDIEDSLIFSRIASVDPALQRHNSEPIRFSIVTKTEDSVFTVDDCGVERRIEKDQTKFRSRHPMRGMILKELAGDSMFFDTSGTNMGAMVMKQIRLSDSTGEHAHYQILSWQSGDTMIEGVMSRPQMDFLAGKKMALINPNYKADIFHDLLPHISFAIFLWLIVGAAFYYTWKNLWKQIQLNALRDEFVSNITHELKTPITTVGVALESLNMSDDIKAASSRKYLDISRSELRRLSMLVERILHNRSLQVNYQKLDVAQVVDDVMNHMRVQFDNKHAQVDIQHEGNAFVVQGDKSHLSGVLYNLLDNALKYSKENPIIRVRLSKNNGSIRVDVQDQGIGIEEGYHDKIFEKLFRAPQHGRHDVKGHGLGLSYVADVVKQHHGKIDLVSEPGKGSTFSLTLPAWNEN